MRQDLFHFLLLHSLPLFPFRLTYWCVSRAFIIACDVISRRARYVYLSLLSIFHLGVSTGCLLRHVHRSNIHPRGIFIHRYIARIANKLCPRDSFKRTVLRRNARYFAFHLATIMHSVVHCGSVGITAVVLSYAVYLVQQLRGNGRRKLAEDCRGFPRLMKGE